MGTLSDTYFARLREIIEELRQSLSSLPPEFSEPIIAEITRIESHLSRQDPPVD